jgi:hypothetical protein
MFIATIDQAKMSLNTLKRHAADGEDTLDDRFYGFVRTHKKLSHNSQLTGKRNGSAPRL